MPELQMTLCMKIFYYVTKDFSGSRQYFKRLEKPYLRTNSNNDVFPR